MDYQDLVGKTVIFIQDGENAQEGRVIAYNSEPTFTIETSTRHGRAHHVVHADSDIQLKHPLEPADKTIWLSRDGNEV
jgi:hypothetical protein